MEEEIVSKMPSDEQLKYDFLIEMKEKHGIKFLATGEIYLPGDELPSIICPEFLPLCRIINRKERKLVRKYPKQNPAYGEGQDGTYKANSKKIKDAR